MGKKVEKKADKAPTKKPSVKAHTYYKKEGDSLKRLKKSCPKCGPGYFMAAHKSRSTCGRCGYAEFETKAAPKAE